MEQLLWYLLAGTRGGINRIRIIDALLERPRNAHQLAEVLGLDYRTVRHHLKLLTKNNVLARPSGEAYGAVYFLSGLMQSHMAAYQKIRSNVSGLPGPNVAKEDNAQGGSHERHE